VAARLKNGLSIEGVCPVPLVQDWKMHTMGQKVLHAVFDDPEATLREAAAGWQGWSRRKPCGTNPLWKGS